MTPYRGPDPFRIGPQFDAIRQRAGETGIWRQYVSAATGSTSAYLAGGGTTRYYRQQVITALWAGPTIGAATVVEAQLPGGQLMAGAALISTQLPLGSQDEVIWRGVTYRVEGDAIPVHIGGRLWYTTPVKRGDVTG
jgi:hypothetical protein